MKAWQIVLRLGILVGTLWIFLSHSTESMYGPGYDYDYRECPASYNFESNEELVLLDSISCFYHDTSKGLQDWIKDSLPGNLVYYTASGSKTPNFPRAIEGSLVLSGNSWPILESLHNRALWIGQSLWIENHNMPDSANLNLKLLNPNTKVRFKNNSDGQQISIDGAADVQISALDQKSIKIHFPQTTAKLQLKVLRERNLQQLIVLDPPQAEFASIHLENKAYDTSAIYMPYAFANAKSIDSLILINWNWALGSSLLPNIKTIKYLRIFGLKVNQLQDLKHITTFQKVILSSVSPLTLSKDLIPNTKELVINGLILANDTLHFANPSLKILNLSYMQGLRATRIDSDSLESLSILDNHQLKSLDLSQIKYVDTLRIQGNSQICDTTIQQATAHIQRNYEWIFNNKNCGF